MKSKKEKVHRNVRRTQQYRKLKLTRKPDAIVHNKSLLKSAFLNVDGLSQLTLSSIRDTIQKKVPDIFFLLETHRREEETGIDITIPGYTHIEGNRSNVAGDREGGGIAAYWKKMMVLCTSHTAQILPIMMTLL